MKNKDLANGVNMIAWCRAHEKYTDARLAAGDDPAALLAWHEKKLAWLQHERLIHLLVTMLTAGAFLFALGAWLYTGSAGVSLLALGLLVLLGFYLVHYFRLENAVQHWYNIAETLHDAAEASEKEETK
jgi:hypothetical protein